MPLKLKTGQSITVCLDCDAADPIETRTVFVARAQSQGDVIELAEREAHIVSQAESLTDEEFYKARCELLADLLIDWRNLGEHKFERSTAVAALIETLGVMEVTELLNRIKYGQTMSPEEKKS